MKFQHYLLAVLVFVGCSTTSISQADMEQENAALARVVHILNSLAPLIDEAQRQADNNERMQFQYANLRTDVNKIKSGIEQKLQPPALEPRTILSVQGDYLKVNNK